MNCELIDHKGGEVSKAVWLRLALGFGLAPLAPALLYLHPAILNAFLDPNVKIWAVIERNAWLFEISAIYGYQVALPIGIPMYIFLQYVNKSGFIPYLLMGFVFGNLSFLIYILIYKEWYVLSPYAYFSAYTIVLLGLSGMIATVCFWLIARPNKYRLGAFQRDDIRGRHT